MRDYLKVMTRKGLVIMGPPGAGKGALSTNIVNAYDAFHFSSGDAFREEFKTNPERFDKYKDTMTDGKYFPDHVAITLLQENLEKASYDSLVLLDGVPRTYEQAGMLEGIIDVEGAVLLTASNDVLLNRMYLRNRGRYDQDFKKSMDRIQDFNDHKYDILDGLSKLGVSSQIIDTNSLTINKVFSKVQNTHSGLLSTYER